MKTLVITFGLLALSLSACAQTTLRLVADPTRADQLPFETHTAPYTLALNTPLAPIVSLREQIGKAVGLELQFFGGWSPAGEAHVTVITPPEFINVLSKRLTDVEINRIAQDLRIQDADLKVMGVGSGKAQVGDNLHETFFLIVDSLKLREIRQAIHAAYVAKK